MEERTGKNGGEAKANERETATKPGTASRPSNTEGPEQQAALATSLLDEAALYSLANAIDLAEWEAVAITEERERLQSKEGVSEDRLAALDKRRERALGRLPELATRFEQSRVPVVEVREGVAAVQGRVFDASTMSGLPGLVVIAANPQGQALARAATDNRGGFTLQVDPAKASAIMLEIRSGREVVFLDEKPFPVTAGRITQRNIPVTLSPSGSKKKPAK